MKSCHHYNLEKNINIFSKSKKGKRKLTKNVRLPWTLQEEKAVETTKFTNQEKSFASNSASSEITQTIAKIGIKYCDFHFKETQLLFLLSTLQSAIPFLVCCYS